MALYDYKCDACGHEFETEHPMSAPAGADCTKCGEHTENRLIGGTSFLLKGDGWAKDLYHKG
jgi:putative FmdB family regulatory protein